MDYPQTIDYLYSTAPMFQNLGGAAYKEGLENTHALNELLGHPHRAYKTIHIGGTNGKGSVSQMLYSVLRQAGYKVGLYTSPHLKDFRERIIVEGQMIPPQAVVDFVEKMRPDIEQLHPSFFEITTIMALDWFRQEAVDIAVIEVGMGGRLDCTNVISPLVSVITNISLDHTQYLGDTLPKIATEKAGIIKPDTPVIIGEYQHQTAPILIAQAHEMMAPITFADQRYRCTQHQGPMYDIQGLLDDYTFTLQLGMEGDYQQHNLCTTLATLDTLNEQLPQPLTTMAVRRGLADARVKGRWQTITTATDPCPIICDTGHNEAGITLVTQQLNQQTYHTLYFILGVVADKDLDHILPLLPRDAHYIFTQATLPRALNARELASRASAAGLQGDIIPTIPAALAHAKALATPSDLIFIGGSTFTVAEVL